MARGDRGVPLHNANAEFLHFVVFVGIHNYSNTANETILKKIKANKNHPLLIHDGFMHITEVSQWILTLLRSNQKQ